LLMLKRIKRRSSETSSNNIDVLDNDVKNKQILFLIIVERLQKWR